MATIGNLGQGTLVNIPDLQSPANIVTAFSNYHLGINGTNTEPTNDSIAGHLKAIDTRIDGLDVKEKESLSSNTQDLNSLIEPKTWYRETTPPVGKNYPVITGTSSTHPGFLFIETVGSNLVYQTYTMVNIPEGNQGVDNSQRTAFFWRSGVISGGVATWTAWVQGASVSAISSLNLSKQDAISGTASRVLVTDTAGKLSNSSITTITATELGSLSGISSGSSIQTQLNGKADTSLSNLGANTTAARTNLGIFNGTYPGAKIFIQATAPTTGMVAGDLWFWGA